LRRVATSATNWGGQRALVVPDVMTLKTLADVRELMRHLPADRRDRTTWRHDCSTMTIECQT